ncbi:prephenate dehydratase [Leucobacter chromiireducens]|uniref:Prephenate dehydratase n=1 Tax=Leucobacter chromiireducens subsp. solipictus TaxID=398235 RepID=A0ABS1SGE8_9MICO|nr:prephenate dehydratase [Leucobacter chromiireducens]MBL3679631.1 prephenate dehydratase [Leucobacter chromiireducens subsp. solipictus]
MSAHAAPLRRYSYLGPAGTFTEAALKQVPEAVGQDWHPVENLGEALADVVSGRSDAAMIAIENSIDGGVTVAQDALATMPGLRIIGEYLVPVSFVLVARPGMTLDRVTVVSGHPVAYGQCRTWLDAHTTQHRHLIATSNVQAAADLFDAEKGIDAAIAPPGIEAHYDVEVLAEGLAENPDAMTRFVLVSRTVPVGEPTGADKTSLIVELPEDRSGALLDLLEQFATRGVNLTLLASRPIGDRMGRYRFVLDAEGHVKDARVADALLGIKRFSPRVVFLGSYPRADRVAATTRAAHDDDAFRDARDWLRGVIEGTADGEA